MRVLVIGAGVYVTGRGTDGLGTVLPALAEASKTLPISQVTVVARRAENRPVVAAATERVNSLLGTSLRAGYAESRDLSAVLAASPSFDCAIVVVPDHLHAELGAQVLEAGLHVLMVKPLAPSLAEARRLESLRVERGLYGMVEFHKRWDESNLVVRRLLEEGRLGRPAYFDVEYSQKRVVPLEYFRGWAAKSNIFQYLGVHYVDLIYFLTDALPTRAMAVGTRGLLDAAGVPTWDSVHATVEWRTKAESSSRFLSHFSTNWIDPSTSSAMSDQKYRVVGEHGRIECDQKHRGLSVVTEEEREEAINPYFSQFLSLQGEAWRFSGYGCASFRTFLEDVDVLRRNLASSEELSDKRPTFRQALVSTAVVEAVNESLADGGGWRPVDAAP